MKHRCVFSFAMAAIAALSYFAAATWSQAQVRRQVAIRPVPFQSDDGAVTGWKVTIPGQKPLATPAGVDGRAYVRGGFGRHEFYALDASRGKPIRTYHTADARPTAPGGDGPPDHFNRD